MSEALLVEMRGISKVFGGVKALDGVDFSVRPGEVHILLGENGAGKSTLMKILSGVHAPSSGTIMVKGELLENLTPSLAQRAGIAIIHQELSVVNELSVAENIFVGRLPLKNRWVIDYKRLKSDTTELLQRVGLDVDPDEEVGNLKISQKQMIEIAKALSMKAEVIIMDEPTSSLTSEEIGNLFRIIRQLQSEGVGIVYISHKLEEVMTIGDRVTVLKDGTYMGTKAIKDTTTDDLIRMMVGHDLQSKYSDEVATDRSKKLGKVKLEVRGLSRYDGRARDVSFQLHEGEILGFFGLIGSGRTETARAIIGADPKQSGEVFIDGQKADIRSPYDALKFGIGLIPENRREEGFCANLPLWQNISLPYLLKTGGLYGLAGLTNKAMEQGIANRVVENLRLKCDSLAQDVLELSGGNQQKVVVGKWLETGINVYFFDEPTRGIDVGVKQSIHDIIKGLARNEGKAVAIISSELPELLATCDRIIVFREGVMTADLPISEATKEAVMYAATMGRNSVRREAV